MQTGSGKKKKIIITSKTKNIGNLFKAFGKIPINTIFSSKLYWTVLAPKPIFFSLEQKIKISMS